MHPTELLWPILRDPETAARLDLRGWDVLVRQARQAKVLGRLAVQFGRQKLLDAVPEKVRGHLVAARVEAEKHGNVMRWEIDRLRRALASSPVPVVLLKGAAYVAADLPPACGRLFADMDILVPKTELGCVEQMLLCHGWATMRLHPYDQRYYRTWMHELPPLRHVERGTVLDVHHAILPESGRLHPDPQKLFADARPLGDGRFQILAPPDMVLHSAAHLFQDGDLAGGLRDLVDLDDLLRHFGRDPQFWDELLPRALELELARPLWYAIYYTRWFLRTPVPPAVMAAAEAYGPGPVVGGLMQILMTRALEPGIPEQEALGTTLARWLLYVRSHWLRMPPLLLAWHLLHKALRSHGPDERDDEPPNDAEPR